MSRISHDEVQRIAALARLSFSDQEVTEMRGHLDSILDYAEQLSELDTEDVEVTTHVVPVSALLRDDIAQPSLSNQLALQNAPAAEEGAFLVPKVIDGEAG
jgi:aspartyl-tRNA(Asn)/glutamyl-tRNA(Gln) amidotransferase subunit C